MKTVKKLNKIANGFKNLTTEQYNRLYKECFMKIYLDDERKAPPGWRQTTTAWETIDLLFKNNVNELSLDHDLGDDILYGTGYDVLLFIEKEIALYGYIPPKIIKVHSANSSARIKMELAIRSINKMKEKGDLYEKD